MYSLLSLFTIEDDNYFFRSNFISKDLSQFFLYIKIWSLIICAELDPFVSFLVISGDECKRAYVVTAYIIRRTVQTTTKIMLTIKQRFYIRGIKYQKQNEVNVKKSQNQRQHYMHQFHISNHFISVFIIQFSTYMKFFKKITANEIFERITEIAGIKLKQDTERQKNVEPHQQKREIVETNSINNYNVPTQISKNKQIIKEDQELTYQDSQNFILNLASNIKIFNEEQAQKRRKKQIYQQLQVEPIYLQKCQQSSLLRMQCQIGLFQGAQRAQILHNYLNQVKQAIKKLLIMSDVSLLQFFQIYNKYVTKVQIIYENIKHIRNNINKIKIDKYKQIELITRKRLILKQKLSLLKKMKQKNEFAIVYPKNLDQIYYSERNRHKMYIKIKRFKTGQETPYFLKLKKQIIQISKVNIKIIQQNFQNWINDKQMAEKQIQKMLICVYFIKSEALYKDNQIDFKLNFTKISKLKQKLQIVKKWKQYKYIRDPQMKDKIVQFLDQLPTQIKCGH